MTLPTPEALEFLRLAAAGTPIPFLGRGPALARLLLKGHIRIVAETSTHITPRLSETGALLLLELEASSEAH